MGNAYNVKALCYSGLQRAWRRVAMWAGKIFFSQRRSHFAESEKKLIAKYNSEVVNCQPGSIQYHQLRLLRMLILQKDPKAQLFDLPLTDAESQSEKPTFGHSKDHQCWCCHDLRISNRATRS